MKLTYTVFLSLVLASCGSSADTSQSSDTIINQPVVPTAGTGIQTDSATPSATATDSAGKMDLQQRTHDTQSSAKTLETQSAQPGVPKNGTYRYDMAFAEFKGASRGEKVTVIINGDSIRVVYEGDGNINKPKGTVIDQGLIIKHKSGRYIISKNKSDVDADVVGGCSGGPAIIDFENKKYHTC